MELWRIVMYYMMVCSHLHATLITVAYCSAKTLLGTKVVTHAQLLTPTALFTISDFSKRCRAYHVLDKRSENIVNHA